LRRNDLAERVAQSTNPAMISRSRSAPTTEAMSIERTTSAKRTVTCLYSADGVACRTGAPHSLQNLAVAPNCVPHDPQDSPVAVSSPPPSPLWLTSVSFHCWSAMSVTSPCHLRYEVSRLSYVVCFETVAGRVLESLSHLGHDLSPGDMPLKLKRSRHVAVAIPEKRVSRGIAVSPRQ